MNPALNEPDEDKEINSNINIDLSKVPVIYQKSTKYTIYKQQMEQLMLEYPELDQSNDQDHQHFRTVFTHIFEKKKKSFKYQSSDYFLQVSVLNNTKSKDYISIEIRYNNRIISNVSLFIKAEGSPFHQNCSFSSGNYANVYKAKLEDKFIAVKCFRINEQKTIFTQFVKLLKQFSLLSMAEQIGAGPSPGQIKGFNIMIYRNCMEFTMEYCHQVSSYTPKMEKDLREALMKLHRYRIIHCDIKPQNICYSSTLDKYIFVDFGLSEFIPQKLGETKVLSFRGTIGYCSDEMRICQQLSYGVVDPYYNDLHCLNESLSVLKQFSTELQERQKYFHTMDSSFKRIQIYRYLLGIDLNKSLRHNIYLHIKSIKTYQQCQQFISIIQQFPFSYEINLAFSKISKKQNQLNRSKIQRSYALNGIEIASIDKNNQMIQQETINTYCSIFQSQQRFIQDNNPDNFRIYTEIECFGQEKYQKIEYIRNMVEQEGICRADSSTQEVLLEYYKMLFKKINKQKDGQNKMMNLSHFLPSFLLFNVIEQQQLISNFMKCILFFQEANRKLQIQSLWILIIMKFMMSIQWIQFSFSPTYQYEKIQSRLFYQLNNMFQRMPQGYFGYEGQTDFHIVLGLLHKFNKSSTIYEYLLLIDNIQSLCIQRDIRNQLLQSIQYLYCLMIKRVSFSSLYREFFDRKINSIILENRQLGNLKLYPFYLNVFNCIYRLSHSHAKWVMERVNITISDFSFFTNTFLYYYDREKILNFDLLGDQIRNIAINIQQEQGKITYLHKIIKIFISNKQGSLITKQKQLNNFISSFGQQENIFSHIINRIDQQCQSTLHLSHNAYISQITVLFRYFIGGIISQNVINVKNYQNNYLNQKKIIVNNSIGINIKLFVNKQIDARIRQRQNILISIRNFMSVWYNLPIPSCLTCKIRYSVYLQLLKSLNLLLQGDTDKSFELFTVLMMNSHHEKNLQLFSSEALSIYFYFYYLKSINLQQHHLPIFTNLAIQIIYKNSIQLLHILLSSYQLYYQLLKQTLILYPLTTMYQLILPTTLNISMINNFKLCKKMQIVFITSWRRLKNQLSPDIFQSIWQNHIYIDLMTFIDFAMKQKQPFFFYSISYILSIMRMFQLPLEKCLNLYRFISIALQYQPRNLKYFYIGQFYQVLFRNVECSRFYRFKNRKIWKLKIGYDKEDYDKIISVIKAKWEKGTTGKKLYKIMHEKIIKYAPGDRYK